MALEGKLDVQADMKSSADKYWDGIVNSAELFPKIFPDQYKCIEKIEGDGKSVGSVRQITYGEGIPLVSKVSERLEEMDHDNKTVTYSLMGDLLTLFKSFKCKFQVVPAAAGVDGCTVKWLVEYEKMNSEVSDPNAIAEIAMKTFRDFDEYLLKN